jgi:hypothetical protein
MIQITRAETVVRSDFLRELLELDLLCAMAGLHAVPLHQPTVERVCFYRGCSSACDANRANRGSDAFFACSNAAITSADRSPIWPSAQAAR